MYIWYREKYFFYKYKICNYTFAQRFSRENRDLEERQIWLGRHRCHYGRHYGSCFNASLSRYTL